MLPHEMINWNENVFNIFFAFPLSLPLRIDGIQTNMLSHKDTRTTHFVWYMFDFEAQTKHTKYENIAIYLR